MIGGYVGSLQNAGNIAANGTAQNTYTTAKTVINNQQLVTLPSNYWYPGKKFRVRAAMGISNIVTSQPQFTFQLMMGSIVVWSSGAIYTTTTAHTNLPAILDVELKCLTVGATTAATLIGVGKLNGIMFQAGAAANADGVFPPSIPVPVTTPAAGTGFDSTIANVLDFWVGISASNAGNGVQVFDFNVEDLN